MSRSLAAGLAALVLLTPVACKRPLPPAVAAFRAGTADPAQPVPAQFAGEYYEPGGEALAKRITDLLNEASVPAPGPVLALVLPHAGLRFSGAVAAEALAAVRDRRFERVIILGASHTGAPTGAALPRARSMATPLGELSIDPAAAALLEKQPGFRRDDGPFRGEHSVELVLPFVQKALGPVPIVPLVVGPTDAAGARALASGLRQLLDSRTLLLVSTDFTRYGDRFGFTGLGADLRGRELQARIREADEILFQPLLQGDLDRFDQVARGGQVLVRARPDAGGEGGEGVATLGSSVCGLDALRLLLAVLPPGARGTVRKYDNSFARDPDLDQAAQASYAAIAFPGAWPEVAPFSEADRAALLARAREALAAAVAGRQPGPPQGGSPRLAERHGLYLTAFLGGEVRASVGRAESDQPLLAAVADLAAAAARAPGFEPLRPEELPGLKLELSVLGPLRPIKSPEALRVGEEGLLVGDAGHQGLLLPQVARALHLSSEEYLDHLAEQVALPRKAWQLDALRAFTVQVVAEPGAGFSAPGEVQP